jgi:prepilin-type N-terminal cleavage/methylation domain-containing protein
MKNINGPKRALKPIHGFTLIELLVVVAIITVLIAILLPSLGKARETARKVVCAQNLKSQGIALNMYSLTFNDYLCPNFNWGLWSGTQLNYFGSIWSAGPQPMSTTSSPLNHGLLYTEKYLNDSRGFCCPSAIVNGGVYFDTPTNRFWDTNPTYRDVTYSSYYYWLRTKFGQLTGKIYTYKTHNSFESPTTAIMADDTHNADMVAHNRQTKPGFNVLYLDGGVNYWADTEGLYRSYVVGVYPGSYLCYPGVWAVWSSFDAKR